MISSGDMVKLLTHNKHKEYKVHGVQFIYSDFEKNEGEIYVRLLTVAHGQKWYSLVPVSGVTKL